MINFIQRTMKVVSRTHSEKKTVIRPLDCFSRRKKIKLEQKRKGNQCYRPENCWEFKHERVFQKKITTKQNRKNLLLQSLVMLCGADNPWFYCGRPPALNWLHVVAARIDINVIVSPINGPGFKWQILWHCPRGREKSMWQYISNH